MKPKKQKSKGILHAFTEIIGGLLSMPKTMLLQLAVVQFFTWFGLNAMWAFMTPTVASNIFQTKDTESAAFQEAGNWAGVMFACYSLCQALQAFLLPVLAKATSRKTTHLIALALGGISISIFFFIHDKYMLLLPMIGVGIAWASLLSMPYAILVGRTARREARLLRRRFQLLHCHTAIGGEHHIGPDPQACI
ncbi:MAG: hypothetical protein U5K75_00510 [Ahrensia sp.]|nr:hypothetical protein [Ahrensia sp.]